MCMFYCIFINHLYRSSFAQSYIQNNNNDDLIRCQIEYKEGIYVIIFIIMHARLDCVDVLLRVAFNI